MTTKKITSIILTGFFIATSSTTALAIGNDELTKTNVREINLELEKDIEKELDNVISDKKYKDIYEVQKCFAYGGDAFTKTNRAVILEICSINQIEEEDALAIYTRVLKEVKQFNSKKNIPVTKVGVWFVDASTGSTSIKWILEGDKISCLNSINFNKKEKAKMEVLRLLENNSNNFMFNK